MNTQYLDLTATNLHDRVDVLINELKKSSETNDAANEVELHIHQSLRTLGFKLLEMFFARCGDGDQGAEITTPEGDTLRRLTNPHTREYKSIFGDHNFERFVYGTREGQKIECIPFDAKLNLPESKFSYLLQDWDQAQAIDAPYAKVSETLERILGFSQSTHSLGRMNRHISNCAQSFWENELPTPPAEEEGKIFVSSADGKGVPIRKPKQAQEEVSPVNQNPLESDDKDAKKGKKKVALVGATYTVDPYIRSAEEVVEALFRDKDKEEKDSPRPKPKHKHVRASLLRDEKDTSQESYDEIFSWIANEEKKRNADAQKDVVCIMDGQDSLWKAINIHLPGKDKKTIEILDLLHACGYIWEATHLFYKKKSDEAVVFARARILRVLQGDVLGVVRGLQWKATHEKLADEKLESLDKICGYLRNNAHRMKYDEYLKAGYPIASGVIEGACRYAVKDRMERTGMSWILNGAHSMLALRCIHLSGYWEELMCHRIKVECERLYPWRSNFCSNDEIYKPLALVA